MTLATSNSLKEYTDMTGRRVSLSGRPLRIVSVVPSLTELLFHLGLEEEIVGVTKFCVHPATLIERKEKVGGTKRLWIDKIKELQPDFIIANKEENTRSDIDHLAEVCPVWVSDINNLDEALVMIREVGKITFREEEAERLSEDIEKEFSKLMLVGKRRRKALYLIWKNPYMSVGADTFIHDMLNRMGMDNVMSHELRYPELPENKIRQLAPDFIFLSTEPYPFKQQHAEELSKVSPRSKIVGVDGEMFSWYGSRLQYAPAYFRELQELM
ncbi:ABC transporter substrate-binding protein [Roseivirga sp. BDSF3-8]|uniref:ABC transporter substrate-binding protein n=1 Tax=Roseivirga sp. BDSF3-8 TaxID=3241598 RepID=UPI00353235DC